MLKVVYFDEASALDSLDQINKGRIEEITKKMIDKANEISGKVEIDGKANMGFLSLFKAGFGTEAKGEFSRKGSNILTTTLTNTILTSFLEIVDEDADKGFVMLKDYKLRIIPDSFTFLKTITPFIKVYSNQADVVVINKSDQNQEGNPSPENLDYSLFDEVLTNAKGYYELLAINGHNRKIVRFNLDGLRNNYRLTDLRKMNLTMYGIQVGSCTEESLHFKNEIEDNNKEEENTGFNPFEEDEYINRNELEIIDVILAGIR